MADNNNKDVQLKEIYDPKVERRTVIDTPSVQEGERPSLHPYIIQLAIAADDIPQWGTTPVVRDKKLREFWVTEPLLASAVYGVTIRNASFAWEVVGSDPSKPNPKYTVSRVTEILKRSNRGKGWQDLMLKTCTDLYCTDNGAFWHLIRKQDRPDSPVLNITHLDSARCLRTGDPKYPVIYTDRMGREHILRWYEVVTIEEFPSPVEEMYGMQVCAVSRCLRAAQILRDIAVYKHEKVSGAWTRSVHFISNVTQSAIENAVDLAEEQNLNRGLYRYSQPVVIAGLDPKNPISHAQVDLASLPDAFDEETTFKWYIAQLALAFGVDYQEFAPLMSGNLGSSQQAEILHLKTRGKGPALIMTVLENVLNDHGILPNNVIFRFKEQDVRTEREKADTKFARAKQRSMMLRSGEIDEEAARQLAVEDGDIPEWMATEIAARRKKEEKEEQRLQTTGNNNAENTPGSEFGVDQIVSGIDSHNERQVKLVSMKDVEIARQRLVKFKESSYGPPEMCAILGFESWNEISSVQDYLKLIMPDDDGIRWTYPRDFHITLVYAQLMSWDQAQEIVSRFTASDVDFELEVDGLGVFEQPSYNALYLKVKPKEELNQLQRRIYDEVSKMNLPVSDYSLPEQWTPHITLAYLAKNVEIPKLSPQFELQASSMSFTRSNYYDEFVVTKPNKDLERDALSIPE